MQTIFVQTLLFQKISRDASDRPDLAFPYAAVVRTDWWIEYPVDVLLYHRVVDRGLIPLIERFSQLMFSSDEIGPIVRSYLFELTSSSNEPTQRVDARISSQGIDYFHVDCTDFQIGEESDIFLYHATATFHLDRTEIVDTSSGKWCLVWN